ncbi:hypothetical protein FHS85_001737 [Rhodoligotrophos appendicifer]|uniref:hypothetical protein n=1 Tax=Rhodoligotrophos appendicifer TaxID=987056 RepID=UPI0011867910|nr:hypothetical protein [Rhodoligotrophos appendicifer]
MTEGGYARIDWNLVRGDTIPPLDIVWKPNGEDPMDLTGYGADFKIRWADGYLVFTPGDGMDIVRLEGRITIQLTQVQAYNLPPGKVAQHELRLTGPMGGTFTKMKGFLIVTDTLF